MKLSKKIISVILCVIMVFTMSAVAITANAKDDVTPVVFIPGIGQSQNIQNMMTRASRSQAGICSMSTRTLQATQLLIGSR